MLLLVLGLALAILSACDDAPEVRAALALELDEMKCELCADSRNAYHHNRRFVETAGISVTLNHGEVCVEQNCESADVRHRIEPNSSLVQVGHYVATLLPTDVITIRYGGSMMPDNRSLWRARSMSTVRHSRSTRAPGHT